MMYKTKMRCVIATAAYVLFLQSCNNRDACQDIICKKDGVILKTDTMKTKGIKARNTDAGVSCKLTTTELMKRKETVIARLKKQIIERKELTDGYAYKFEGSDTILDELIEFVKSERRCCSFFVFTLSFSGDGSETWLNLTGPDGAKEMITDEIGL